MSNDNSASIVSKVWNYAHVLKNAGVRYGDYVEQISYTIYHELAGQPRIVAEVEVRTTAVDHLEAELDCQIARANRLRQSTLAAAFSGNLVGHRHDDHHLDYHNQHQKAHA